jgi:hypothetical protein
MPSKNPHSIKKVTSKHYGQKLYLDGILDYLKEHNVSRATADRIIRKFNRKLRDMIVDDGFEWNMFGNMGKLAVYKFKPEIKRKKNGQLNLPINWPDTMKLWKEKPELYKLNYVYHMNEHSDGYVCKFFWIKYPSEEGVGFANQSPVTFTSSSRLSKTIRKSILTKGSHENYYIFEPYNYE